MSLCRALRGGETQARRKLPNARRRPIQQGSRTQKRWNLRNTDQTSRNGRIWNRIIDLALGWQENMHASYWLVATQRMAEISLSGTFELSLRVLSDDMNRTRMIHNSNNPVLGEMHSSWKSEGIIRYHLTYGEQFRITCDTRQKEGIGPVFSIYGRVAIISMYIFFKN